MPEDTVTELSRWEKLAQAWVWRALYWLGKVVYRVIRTAVLVLIALFLVLKIPAVQRWTKDTVTVFLSNQLHTSVTASELHIDYFDVLVLRNFCVKDLNGDTLLYAGHLKADVRFNPWTWSKGAFQLDRAVLEDAYLNVYRYAGQPQFNAQFVMTWLNPPSTGPQKSKKQVNFSVDAVSLRRLRFSLNDQVGGRRTLAEVGRGDIDIRKMSFPEGIFAISEAKFADLGLVSDVLVAKPMPAYDAKNQKMQAILSATIPGISAPIDTTPPLRFVIEHFSTVRSHVEVHNYLREPIRIGAADDINYNHLDIRNIAIQASGIDVYKGVYQARIQQLKLHEQSGFEVTNLAVKKLRISKEKVEISDFLLETPQSVLGENLVLDMKNDRFSDFQHFNDSVTMIGTLRDARVQLGDLLKIAPKLKTVPFFVDNQARVVSLDALVFGTVNTLHTQDMRLEIGDVVQLDGKFTSHDLANKGREHLDISLTNLQTDILTLKKLIPALKLPSRFDALGTLDSKDLVFRGFFQDFSTVGQLQTAIGDAQFDIKLNLKPGKTAAIYSGDIALTNFNLGAITQNPNVGIVSANVTVHDGKGLTLESASAFADVDIKTFYFKDYAYQGVKFNGSLNHEQIIGTASGTDPNLDFTFNGEITVKGDSSKYVFVADVRRANLKMLNLTSQDLAVSAKMGFNLNGGKIAELEGLARLENVVVVKDNTDRYEIKDMFLKNTILGSNRHLEIGSDLISADLNGQFDVVKLPNIALDYLRTNLPVYAEALKIKPSQTTLNPYDFTFDIRLRDSRNWLTLIAPKLDTLRNLSIAGEMSNTYADERFILNLDVPEIRFDKQILRGVGAEVNLQKQGGTYVFNIDKPIINGKSYTAVSVNGGVKHDTITFAVALNNFAQQLDHLSLSGVLSPLEHFFKVSFKQSNLVLFNDRWDITDDNYVLFNKDSIITQDFTVSNGIQRIELETFGRRGLVVNIENLDFGLIDTLWKYDNLNFAGKLNMKAQTSDIFDLSKLEMSVNSDSLFINNDDFGALRLNAFADNIKSPITTSLTLTKPTQSLSVNGSFNPANKFGTTKEQSLAYSVSLKNYPLHILHYFILTGITNAVGTCSGDIKVKGWPEEIRLRGEATVKDVGVTINYLNTRYSIPNGTLRLYDHLFDATDTKIYDELGNPATIYGGLTHDYLKNFGLNIQVLADKALALNTTREINPLYYGRGIGKFDIRFDGDFAQTDITIKATTAKGTDLTLPFDENTQTGQVNFVKFRDKTQATNPNTAGPTRVRGVNLDMELTVTEDADLSIIFNEQTGDVIKSVGKGNLQILTSRLGDFRMYGTYQITKGEYLFTLFNVIFKPFKVAEGGTINWTGDPLGATINLNAIYAGSSSTPPYNFISEYLPANGSSAQIITEAKKSTQVDLFLNMTGPLLRPEVSFDFAFPRLYGPVKNYTDSKLRTIRQDPNDLNRQVIALLVMGGFIPSNTNAFSTGYTGTKNTASEYLTTQLSTLVNEVLADYVEGLDIDFNVVSTELINATTTTNGTELQFRIKKEATIAGREVSIRGGVDVGRDIFNSGTFVGGDIGAEMFISKDRRIKIQIFNTSDQALQGRRNRVGFGLIYRQEFDSFDEFFQQLRRKKVTQ